LVAPHADERAVNDKRYGSRKRFGGSRAGDEVWQKKVK